MVVRVVVVVRVVASERAMRGEVGLQQEKVTRKLMKLMQRRGYARHQWKASEASNTEESSPEMSESDTKI
ncbi:hypothetical protein [Erythrobacter sp. WG]|uniref:hypothetical protein n=1 Tax=Erythrobacter sp. WG TaxID=2985510 RepID=UPI00226E900C|nr:hypothetical protein [Erythrobacter sp. WG]MCX9146932.1 hypothetical protein [Erythrobacter sp. WG]